MTALSNIRMTNPNNIVFPGCCICFSNGDLFNILETFEFMGKPEIYSGMISECFRINLRGDVKDDLKNARFFICKNCITRLKDAIYFKLQIESAHVHMQDVADKLKKTEALEAEMFEIDNTETLHSSLKIRLRKVNTCKKSLVQEEIESRCCFCLSEQDLFSAMNPYDFNGKIEIYTVMILECFRIDLKAEMGDEYRNMYKICKSCIYRLRNAADFHLSVLYAYDRIQGILESLVSKSDSPELITSLRKRTVKLRNRVKPSSKKPAVKKKRKPNSLPDTKGFTCDICGKVFTCKYNMGTHLKTHSGTKRFGCDLCDKSFTRRNDLRTHKLIHSGTKNFNCEVCNKKFTQKSHLKPHMLTHQGTRKFSCGVCEKTFLYKSNLVQHMKVHSEAKNFICDTCDKVMACKRDMEKHMMVHFGKKEFTCEFCGIAIMYKSNLLRHMRMHRNAEDERKKSDLHSTSDSE